MFDKLRIIINKFGEKEDLLIMILFIISFFLISSLIKFKKIRIIFSIIAGLFLSLQLLSLYFTNSFIGYQFFIHSNLRGTQDIFYLFIPQIIVLIILLIIIIFVFYKSHDWFYKRLVLFFRKKIKPKNIRIGILVSVVLLFGITSSTGNFISDSKSLISVFQTNQIPFKDVLKKNGMGDYITPKNIKSKKGKNIIVISLESLEKAYLGNKFSELTPNLQRLKKDWNYYNLEQNVGSEWTSGSLYTSLTGFPSFFGVEGNSIFEKAYLSEISSVTHVLENAGYNSIYLSGNTDFSGIKDMVNVLHFDKIIDYKNVDTDGNESRYGLRDKDLFEFAKKEIEIKSITNQPFALFISTTDTHFPNGIYDKRMESFISNQKSDLEFMVAAVDYMIGDFISFLEKEKLFENTTIYIFPDHLKMGDPSMFNNTGDRGLYLITNAKREATAIDTLQKLYQIDLPKIILNGAKIEHNVKFLSDYINGNKETFIKNNILEITEINTNGIRRIASKPFNLSEVSPNYLTYKKDTMRYIAHAGGRIEGNNYSNSKEALDLSYKKGFRLFELDIIQTKDGKFVAAHDWEHWSKITNFKGDIPVNMEQFLKYKLYNKFTPLDIAGINDWFATHNDAILITDKINDPVEFSKKFIDPNRLMMELFTLDAVKAGIKAKIRSAIPSQNVIANYSKEDIKSLKKMGVKHIAISRKFISDNQDLLSEFKANNIKAYAYHINFDNEFDEEYVTKYEMDFIYGIYADEWSFE